MPVTLEQRQELVQLVTRLLDARIAGDIVQLDARTWAIHGTIAVDGNVLVAEFDSLEDARTVLVDIAPNQPDPAPARASTAT
jgi:hypothetical protein